MNTLKVDPTAGPRSTRQAKFAQSVPIRVTVAGLVILGALGAQLALGPALLGIAPIPNLVLLLVVAAGVARGRDFAALLGFGLGLLLDLGPASDHLAGRWALSLVIVGYLVGTAARGRVGSRPRRPVLLGLAVAASFVGTSVFALTGVLLRDPAMAIPEVLQMILGASLSDGLLGVVLLPFLIGVFGRLSHPQDS